MKHMYVGHLLKSSAFYFYRCHCHHRRSFRARSRVDKWYEAEAKRQSFYAVYDGDDDARKMMLLNIIRHLI